MMDDVYEALNLYPKDQLQTRRINIHFLMLAETQLPLPTEQELVKEEDGKGREGAKARGRGKARQGRGHRNGPRSISRPSRK